MSFVDIEAFYLLPLLLLFLVKKSSFKERLPSFSDEMYRDLVIFNNGKKSGLLFLVLSLFFIIVSLARPIYHKTQTTEQESVNIAIAIDISKSMKCEDIYPNRLEVVKTKLKSAISSFEKQKVSMFAFSNLTYLISPPTSHYSALEFLAGHIEQEGSSQRGSNFINLLEAVQKIHGDGSKKGVLILTDGGEQDRYEAEIEYAREHGISVYVYAVGTESGSVIKDGSGLLKDRSGNIVITALNPVIESLASGTGGKYMEYSLASGDIEQLIGDMTEQLRSQSALKESKNYTELFPIPLLLAFGLYLFASKRRLI